MESSAATQPTVLLAPAPGAGRRKAVNRTVEVLCTIAAAMAVAVLLVVVSSVLIKGLPAINLDLLTENPVPFGQSGGGIANSIVGSAILIGLASLIAIPVGILTAIYAAEFAPRRISSAIKFALDILNGVPTIVTGVFIFGVL